MVVIVGSHSEAKNVAMFLEENQHKTLIQAPDDMPSITSLVLDNPSVSDMVFLQGAEQSWSMGHLLAAAKLLEGRRGHVIFVSSQNTPPRMIWSVPDMSALLKALTKSTVSTTGSGGKIAPLKQLIARATRSAKQPWLPKPLDIPPGKVMILGVAGTQRRIGCTTHAIGIWHYCKKLGFDPAIVSTRERIAEMAAPMKSEQIQDGYRIEGIPFVVNTAQSYDCYVIDIGTDPLAEAVRKVDLLLLIAGIKPWELQHTMAAMNATKEDHTPVLLSYATEEDVSALKPMFAQRRLSVSPWIPDLWNPSDQLLSKYEYLLYPMLEWIMTKAQQIGVEQDPESDLESEPDIESKGE